MIKKILLHNTATFTNPVTIDNLTKINFFFGANGTGKTTISKVLSNSDNYSGCKVDWENNNKIKTIIYNEDFVRNYFYEKDLLNGIYTIGESAKEIEEKIKSKKNELDKLNNELNNLNNEKRKQEDEKNKLFENFKETCWQKGYLDLQNDFDSFFTGYKKDKEKFAEKILKEQSNSSELLDKTELKRKYDLIYGGNVEKINEIIFFDNETLEEIKQFENNESILQLSIIGKKDIDIAKMIEKLHNHDWVKQGKEYYDKNIDEDGNSLCPFCQQKTSDDFRKQLEEYFDETYQNNLNELNKYIENYSNSAEKVIQYLSKIDSLSNKYINEKKSTLKDKCLIIVEIISQNKQLLEKKQKSPSEKIEIKHISENINEVNKIQVEINNRIKEHNELIDNKKTEKSKLDNEIWKFIYELIKNDVERYSKENDNIVKAIESISQQIKQKHLKIKDTENEIRELEKQIKSVKPTVDAINKILENFGFTGFKLKATEDDKHYQVIRNDGSEAKKTLSEGERNFLVFLYFYYLIYGVENPEDNIYQDKILIIDDPISSLDSEVLFIVSTLIKGILNEIRLVSEKNSIKQVFILTHNAYFFKEITYISSRASCYNKRNDTMYYIIRKRDNTSFIDSYEVCPIKTSYQLLWDDIKNDNKDSVSIQNSMRRIIEFYFKFLSNLNEEDLLSKFDGKEKNVCKSLIAWVNFGSHEIIDDFNFSITDEQKVMYKNVFKKIFEQTGHIGHYNMMMNEELQRE